MVTRRTTINVRRLQHASSPIPDGRQDELRSFYGETLGLREVPVPRTLADRGLVWFAAGGDDLELHFFPGVPDPEHPRHLCLEVEDLEAARERLSASGYQPNETIPIPGRPRFLCRDPFGNLIEFTTIVHDYRHA